MFSSGFLIVDFDWITIGFRLDYDWIFPLYLPLSLSLEKVCVSIVFLWMSFYLGSLLDPSWISLGSLSLSLSVSVLLSPVECYGPV